MRNINELTDRELDALLTEWGQENRARIDAQIASRKDKFRPVLMQHLRDMSSPHPTTIWSVFSLLKNIVVVLRVPAGVTASLVLVVGLFGSITYASQMSLPGDALYPFKLQLERAQIELLPLGAPRLEKKVAFAQRRLQEFLLLEQRSDTIVETERAPLIRQAVVAYREDIQNLSRELTALRGTGDAKHLVAVAMHLDDAAADSLVALKGYTKDTALAADIKQTRRAAQTVSVRAIEVIAESHEQAGLTSTQVQDRIQQKISSTRAAVAGALTDSATQKPAENIFSSIQQQLRAAEDHLAKRDFGNALFKLNSSQALANEADSITTILKETDSAPVLPAPIEAKPHVPAPVIKPSQSSQDNAMQIEVWYSPSKPAYYFNEGDQRQAQ